MMKFVQHLIKKTFHQNGALQRPLSTFSKVPIVLKDKQSRVFFQVPGHRAKHSDLQFNSNEMKIHLF